MTEENNLLDSEESVSAGESSPEEAALPSGIAPLIPGTEIIGRRARRAALLAGASEPSEASSELSGMTAEASSAEDQIPLWDTSLLESEADGDADQIPLWDDVAIDDILARAQSWMSGEDESAVAAEADASEDVEPLENTGDTEPLENTEDVESLENTEDPEIIAGTEAAGETGDATDESSSDLPKTDSEEFWNQLLSEDYYTPIEQIPRRRRPGEGSGGRRGKRPAGEIDDRLKRSSNKPKSCAVSPFVEFVEVVVGALVAAILVLTLICRTGVVDGSSMVPTMYHGDRYIISDLFYVPERGDIVVFRPEIDGEDELWIKRVIATEGQTVYIDPESYQVYVDGRLLSEPYLDGAGTIPHSTENPVTVPEGCVYVLGDNRAISHDSRYSDLGCVEIGQLAGRVILRFWPLESFGICE